MHGFPDDSRIYDRIIPLVTPRRVVVLDFSGFGKSDRGQETTLRPGQREAELGAVLTELGIDRCILVGHDASGAVAVNFTLDHAESVDRLVLLNCYYGDAPSLQFPELIRLLGDTNFKPLADALMDDPKMRQWILAHTQERFGCAVGDPDSVVAASVVLQWFGGWDFSTRTLASKCGARSARGPQDRRGRPAGIAVWPFSRCWDLGAFVGMSSADGDGSRAQAVEGGHGAATGQTRRQQRGPGEQFLWSRSEKSTRRTRNIPEVGDGQELFTAWGRSRRATVSISCRCGCQNDFSGG
ncbi:2-hydroxy-6-oxo-6-phenylhexa-2,4-dienoate hydrolase [Streptomyces sp. MBT84]|uniref:alpha/beta fold hydrolase n=1 Tax=unclassified Streptomyces TaxID=2593676 RepID=UPI001C6F1ED9|nr:alpha/beta hydrolase [Streptomyces sp. MBT84]MBW8702029.1 2-hydroxy-6-oxo-6-phenylhexa-2,4-dienoate hydrolase [Streptomyces sp. MBT84]